MRTAATISKNWVGDIFSGHWEVSNGSITLACDDDELLETIAELRSCE